MIWIGVACILLGSLIMFWGEAVVRLAHEDTIDPFRLGRIASVIEYLLYAHSTKHNKDLKDMLIYHNIECARIRFFL